MYKYFLEVMKDKIMSLILTFVFFILIVTTSLVFALEFNLDTVKTKLHLKTEVIELDDSIECYVHKIIDLVKESKDIKVIIYKDDSSEYIEYEACVVYDTLYFILLIVIFSYLLTGLPLMYFHTKEAHEKLVKTISGNEAILANKSMILITENIHHELNTPMEVIDNKVHKIKSMVEKKIKENKILGIKMGCKELEEDFAYISQSSEQIYAVLDRMRGFKHLRYSNGNKSIANIIEGAFKVISISNNNFESTVSEELRKYTLGSENIKNADLLNILINHIKNSLEANASKIYVSFSSIKNNILKFAISDNGNGIKEENVQGIFKPNFSTKEIGDSGLRGNGLYLNKSILNASKGNIQLVETSKYGTTFELSIPVKERKYSKLVQ